MMKTETRLFLLFEILDFLTTYIGIFHLGFAEINPFGLTIKLVFAKVLVIIIVSYFIEKAKTRCIWIFPSVQGTLVAWNFLNIFLYFLCK